MDASGTLAELRRRQRAFFVKLDACNVDDDALRTPSDPVSTPEAASSWGYGLCTRTDSALALHWLGTGATLALALHWLCTGTGSALALHWLCTGSALALHSHWLCTGSALALHWLCTGSALAVHWLCTRTDSALAVHWLCIPPLSPDPSPNSAVALRTTVRTLEARSPSSGPYTCPPSPRPLTH